MSDVDDTTKALADVSIDEKEQQRLAAQERAAKDAAEKKAKAEAMLALMEAELASSSEDEADPNAAPSLQRQKSTLQQEFVFKDDWKSHPTCGLCLEEFEDTCTVIRLTECKGHFFHKDCELGQTIGQYIEVNKKCPVCSYVYGVMTGNQPDGTMNVSHNADHPLPGYSTGGHYYLSFSFPGGTQTEKHYQPGQPYQSDSRNAYLPDDAEGKKVLAKFQVAWDRKILFTIGRSVTRNVDGVVIYNGIHMKTSETGSYGYPDPGYMERVQDELAIKGITDADIDV